MSRTFRRLRGDKPKRKARDGARQFSAASCEHGGSCSWCGKNRQHSSKRRQPIEE